MVAPAVEQSVQDTVLSFSRVGNAVVVTLACPAVREWQSSMMAEYLSEIVEQNRGRAVIVDVAGLRQFSCAWINSLISLTARSRAMGGQLMIAGLSPEARQMLKGTGLLKQMSTAKTSAEALAKLGESAPRLAG